VEAIRETSRRVEHLNAVLRAQSRGVPRLRKAVLGLHPDLTCARRRLGTLVDASGSAPPMLEEAQAIVASLVALQDRSARHLHSINRKLSALGLVADASSSQPLDPPARLHVPVPTAGSRGGPPAPC
jgi:hypothetical protein